MVNLFLFGDFLSKLKASQFVIQILDSYYEIIGVLATACYTIKSSQKIAAVHCLQLA